MQYMQNIIQFKLESLLQHTLIKAIYDNLLYVVFIITAIVLRGSELDRVGLGSNMDTGIATRNTTICQTLGNWIYRFRTSQASREVHQELQENTNMVEGAPKNILKCAASLTIQGMD